MQFLVLVLSLQQKGDALLEAARTNNAEDVARYCVYQKKDCFPPIIHFLPIIPCWGVLEPVPAVGGYIIKYSMCTLTSIPSDIYTLSTGFQSQQAVLSGACVLCFPHYQQHSGQADQHQPTSGLKFGPDVS